ncbi:unnamed protein product [Discosporangium mesarthrocarpum]
MANDVSGGVFDPGMIGAVARTGLPFVMMHMRGTPQTMERMKDYHAIVQQVTEGLRERSLAAGQGRIPRWLHVLDPGIGFAKTHEDSLLLLNELDKIKEGVGCPLLVGPSRKRFIGQILGEQRADQRDWGTAGACCASADRGASILRVHNVKGVAQALAVRDAIAMAAVNREQER